VRVRVCVWGCELMYWVLIKCSEVYQQS
jgi:hypothetical protein